MLYIAQVAEIQISLSGALWGLLHSGTFWRGHKSPVSGVKVFHRAGPCVLAAQLTSLSSLHAATIHCLVKSERELRKNSGCATLPTNRATK